MEDFIPGSSIPTQINVTLKKKRVFGMSPIFDGVKVTEIQFEIFMWASARNIIHFALNRTITVPERGRKPSAMC